MLCEKCGSELKPDGSCPMCNNISGDSVDENNMQTEDENSCDAVSLISQQDEAGKTKKSKKKFIIAGISTAAVLIAAVVAAFIFFFPQQKTFNAVPEDMIKWIEENEDNEKLNVSLVTYLWDGGGKPEVSYDKTNDSNLESFAINGLGLHAGGLVEAESHKITELTVATDMTAISAFSEVTEYSDDTLETLGIAIDKDIVVIVLMNLFDIDKDEAEELLEKSKDEFYYKYNGTKYCIRSYKLNSDNPDLVLIVTTHKDLAEFTDYMEEMKK